jgi:hypothetical protein
MSLTEGIKAGVLDVAAATNKVLGNAAGSDYFYFPNDGKVLLLTSVGAAAKLLTFTAVTDKFGRTEALTFQPTASKNGCVGPFLPDIWNQANGCVKFQPAAGGLVTDIYVALHVATPT